jgi:predicted GIY-YIG superfamily endonuclease
MKELTWLRVQKQADAFLASGVDQLLKSKALGFQEEFPKYPGNYLVSKNGFTYIGESKDLAKRIKQHAKKNTSTFYKNYLKAAGVQHNSSHHIQIEDFKVQHVATNFGRKEIEEFGIVNIPANLNKFQLGKRHKYEGVIDTGLWGQTQSEAQNLLLQGEKLLHAVKPVKWFDAFPESEPGLYWVENEKDGLIYIGESSDLLSRWETHSGTTYFSALRRHIGENILGFELLTINGRKRYFTDKEDGEVTKYLKKSVIRIFPVRLGRYEMEEYLINKYRPLLNRKGNS